jgi:hypothetical protein
MNKEMMDLLITVGIPVVLLLRWLYKRNRANIEMRLAGAAIMTDRFPQALLLLAKMADRELAEIKGQSLNMEPAKMQNKLRRLWLFVEGVGGCVGKMGHPISTDVLVSAIHLQRQLVSQRRIVKGTKKSAAQREKWRQITQQHEQNIGVIETVWGQLQKAMKTPAD